MILKALFDCNKPQYTQDPKEHLFHTRMISTLRWAVMRLRAILMFQ